MIDTLFGSKTRIKLLRLFMNNPGKSFYVREITRKIDEQINSVRRELSNMLEIGVIVSENVDNKLYYQVDQRYKYYLPLKAIFSDDKNSKLTETKLEAKDISSIDKYKDVFKDATGLRLVLFSGVLVPGSVASIDVILVGGISKAKAKSLIKDIERGEGREINYSILSYDEFCYRLSVRDRFINEVVTGNYEVVLDKDNMLNQVQEGTE